MARVSFKIAPGVRISASSRGVRTSLGNSKARVSFGGGRTYTSAKVAGIRVSKTASQSPKSSGSTGRLTLAQLERAERAAAQTSAVEDLKELEEALVSHHQEEFPPARRQEIEAPQPIDRSELQRELEKSQLADISWFRFSARKAAKLKATEQARIEADRIDTENQNLYRQVSLEAEQDWRDLLNHQQEAVMSALETAFADNLSEATCVDVGVENGVNYATVVIVFGSENQIPERAPSVTPQGRPTTKKRTKTDRNMLYVSALGSTILATIKEGFAAAPSVMEFRVFVLRKDLNALTPEEFVTPIYRAEFPRKMNDSLDWKFVDPAEALLAAPDARFHRKGAVGNVMPIDVKDEPELLNLVQIFRSIVRG